MIYGKLSAWLFLLKQIQKILWNYKKKIGEIRKDGILPLIYAAQEALIQVFMNTSGEQAEIIREMILGSEKFHQIVHGSKSNFREQEKAFPTLFYFSGIKARSLENKMGHKASTVYRDGVEFWYRYIYGLAELNEFIEKNKDIISDEMCGEFNKILNHMYRLDGKPENYIIVLRQWLQEAMIQKEIDTEYLLCPLGENEKEKGEELEEKKGKIEIEIEIKEIDSSSSDKFLPVVNSVKISKNRFSMLAEKSGETLSKTREIIMNTMLSCGG